MSIYVITVIVIDIIIVIIIVIIIIIIYQCYYCYSVIVIDATMSHVCSSSKTPVSTLNAEQLV